MMKKDELSKTVEELLEEFLAKGHSVVICAPAIAKGAEMTQRSRRLANTEIRTVRKEESEE